MSLQAIGKDDRLYSQERDIAHNFGWFVQTMLHRMEKRPWETVEDYLRKEGITDEQVAYGMESLSNFVMSARGNDKPMHEAMKEFGWLDADPHVHVAMCAYLGSALIGAFYEGIQEATLMQDDPIKRYPNIRQGAKTAANLVKRPTWRKCLSWAWQDFTSMFRRKG